jgi:hypothetical protein
MHDSGRRVELTLHQNADDSGGEALNHSAVAVIDDSAYVRIDGEKHRLDTFAHWLRWLLGSRFLGVGFFRVNATRIEPKKQEEF